MSKHNKVLNLFAVLIVIQLLIVMFPSLNVYSATYPIPHARVTVKSGSLYHSVNADVNGIANIEIRANETTSIFVDAYGFNMYRRLNLNNVLNGTIFNASLEPGYILYGYVKDPTGNPVVGARVSYASRFTYTDENGLYVLYANLPNSNYQLTVTPPINPMEVLPRESTPYSSYIYPRGGPYNLIGYVEFVGPDLPIKQYNVTLNYSATVSGYVQYSDGTPLNGGTIEFKSSDGKVAKGYIGDDGSYSLSSNLKPSNYSVTIYLGSLSILVANDLPVTCVYPCVSPPTNNFTLPELVDVPIELNNLSPGDNLWLYFRIESLDGSVKYNLRLLSGSQVVISLPRDLIYKIIWLPGAYQKEITQFGPVTPNFGTVNLNVNARYNRLIVNFVDPDNPGETIYMKIEGKVGDTLIYRQYFRDSLNISSLTGIEINGTIQDINISFYATGYYYMTNEPVASITLNSDMTSQTTYNLSKVDTIFIRVVVKASGTAQILNLPYKVPLTFYSEGTIYNGSIMLNPNTPHFLLGRYNYLAPYQDVIVLRMAFPDLTPVNFSLTLPNQVFQNLNLIEHEGNPLSFRVVSSNQSHTTIEVTGVTYSRGNPYGTQLKIYATDVIDEFNVLGVAGVAFFMAVALILRRLSHK